jgi:hypothetical protein
MSLSPAQVSKHWRRWSAVAAANDWTMERGRLSPDARRTAEDTFQHRLIWQTAEELSLQAHRKVTAEDLRHACYLVATTAVPGRSAKTRPAASLHDLENWSFTRLLCLWGDEKGKAGLLIEGDCVESGLCWDDPRRDSEQSLDVLLQRSAPEARLVAICRNAFDCVSWRSLSTPQKQQLLRTVRAERKQFAEPVTHENENENAPF